MSKLREEIQNNWRNLLEKGLIEGEQEIKSSVLQELLNPHQDSKGIRLSMNNAILKLLADEGKVNNSEFKGLKLGQSTPHKIVEDLSEITDFGRDIQRKLVPLAGRSNDLATLRKIIKKYLPEAILPNFLQDKSNPYYIPPPTKRVEDSSLEGIFAFLGLGDFLNYENYLTNKGVLGYHEQNSDPSNKLATISMNYPRAHKYKHNISETFDHEGSHLFDKRGPLSRNTFSSVEAMKDHIGRLNSNPKYKELGLGNIDPNNIRKYIPKMSDLIQNDRLADFYGPSKQKDVPEEIITHTLDELEKPWKEVVNVDFNTDAGKDYDVARKLQRTALKDYKQVLEKRGIKKTDENDEIYVPFLNALEGKINHLKRNTGRNSKSKKRNNIDQWGLPQWQGFDEFKSPTDEQNKISKDFFEGFGVFSDKTLGATAQSWDNFDFSKPESYGQAPSNPISTELTKSQLLDKLASNNIKFDFAALNGKTLAEQIVFLKSALSGAEEERSSLPVKKLATGGYIGVGSYQPYSYSPMLPDNARKHNKQQGMIDNHMYDGQVPNASSYQALGNEDYSIYKSPSSRQGVIYNFVEPAVMHNPLDATVPLISRFAAFRQKVQNQRAHEKPRPVFKQEASPFNEIIKLRQYLNDMNSRRFAPNNSFYSRQQESVEPVSLLDYLQQGRPAKTNRNSSLDVDGLVRYLLG